MNHKEIRDALKERMFAGTDDVLLLKTSELLDIVTNIIMSRPEEDRYSLVQDAPNLTED